MLNWRSMESAPKDGTAILAYCPREQQPYRVLKWGTFCIEDPDGEWVEAAECEYAFEEDAFFAPSRWSPLEPPEDSVQLSEGPRPAV